MEVFYPFINENVYLRSQYFMCLILYHYHASGNRLPVDNEAGHAKIILHTKSHEPYRTNMGLV